MSAQPQKPPQAIRAEIDRTRGEMDHTLSAIEQRLTPGQLVDQGLDYLRHSGVKQFTDNLGGSVKENPLPVALVGVGLAWLMAAGRRPGADGGAEHSAGAMAERASDTLDRTKEKLGAAKDRMTGGLESARASAGDLASGARRQMDRARSGMDYLVQEQPLALGAIGLAIGAVLAAAAPRTEAEDELMGTASDRVGEQAKEAAKEQIDQAAGRTKEALKKAAPASQAQPQQQQQQKDRKSDGAGSFHA
jgi:hypothetical protein